MKRVGRIEQKILTVLTAPDAPALSDKQVADKVRCSPGMVWAVRKRHGIPSGNVLELGHAARRAGLSVADIRALAKQRSAA